MENRASHYGAHRTKSEIGQKAESTAFALHHDRGGASPQQANDEPSYDLPDRKRHPYLSASHPASEVADLFAKLGVLRFHGNEKISVLAHGQRATVLMREGFALLDELEISHIARVAKIAELLGDHGVHVYDLDRPGGLWRCTGNQPGYGQKRQRGRIGDVVRAFVEMAARFERRGFGAVGIGVVLGIAPYGPA